jgi:hypothetical protein
MGKYRSGEGEARSTLKNLIFLEISYNQNMQKPPLPTINLPLSEASAYLDTMIDYYTDLLGHEIHEYDTRKKLYENTTFA